MSSNSQPNGLKQSKALIDFQLQRNTADRPKLNPNPINRQQFSFDSIQDALQAYKDGEFLVVMDDENRENEGDLIIAGHHCTTEKMAWMIRHTSGFICISLPGERLAELDLPMMVSEENQDPHRTAYTVSTDYKHGTTTGISAHDRALTAFALSSSTSISSDFTRPGHLLPLRARPGGILTRRGHTEAGVDLCRLTGLPEAGVLCELVNDLDEDINGEMMRRDQCRAFADKWNLKMISVEMLAEFRRDLEKA
ncbi:3,4-dihydroxy-2-butanone 4-phosphate synthase [Gymnopus androsaceus JB14]|uniref:3,4-dihydroxy-2-butanone 4-phosphate synthase n=1 Tax=Gymnopus androsaceus JB14 TaxID=1447944 RepID=A0A6A4H7H6_9AGAR|nr:3,4-dihydroxy-2-butanone 4-phosphate synthase [Gymnopus androsaceus JB14]